MTLTFADLDAAAERARSRADAAAEQAVAFLSVLVSPYRDDLSQYGGFATSPALDRYAPADPLPTFAQPILHSLLADR